MKLVFPIVRMNWYRVVSTTIEAALAAGHEVECWHLAQEVDARWRINQPDCSRVPAFRAGTPTLREYADDATFLALVDEQAPDAVLSISLPPDGCVEAFGPTGGRPPWVAMATPDTFLPLHTEAQMAALSLCVVRSPHERDCVLHDHTISLGAVLETIDARPGDHGPFWPRMLRERAAHPWSDSMAHAFAARTVCTGYALLDSLCDIDAAAVRARWGLAPDTAVVGCLASPYDGQVMNAPWEHAFAAVDPLRRRAWGARAHGLLAACCPPTNEAAVMRALRRFAAANDAALVVKLRHSQNAAPLYREVAHHLLGEDGYYPHTAVEMAALSSLGLGFFTSGAPETVACGTPFVDVRIPGYNRAVWETGVSLFRRMFDWPGVVWSLEASAWVREASRGTFQDFALDREAWRAYADAFCGPLDGRHAERVVRAVEQRVTHGTAAACPVDAGGWVALEDAVGTRSGMRDAD